MPDNQHGQSADESESESSSDEEARPLKLADLATIERAFIAVVTRYNRRRNIYEGESREPTVFDFCLLSQRPADPGVVVEGATIPDSPYEFALSAAKSWPLRGIPYSLLWEFVRDELEKAGFRATDVQLEDVESKLVDEDKTLVVQDAKWRDSLGYVEQGKVVVLAEKTVPEGPAAGHGEQKPSLQQPFTLGGGPVAPETVKPVAGFSTAVTQAAASNPDWKDQPGRIGIIARAVNDPDISDLIAKSAAGGAAGQTGKTEELPPARHSDDFASVHWYGTDYTFTPDQRHCVEELWKAWANRTPEVADGTLLQKAGLGDKQRLRDVFKDHPAWATMIQRGERRDTLRLVSPTQEI